MHNALCWMTITFLTLQFAGRAQELNNDPPPTPPDDAEPLPEPQRPVPGQPPPPQRKQEPEPKGPLVGSPSLIPEIEDLKKRQEEGFVAILRSLQKLDDLMAAVRDLKGENDSLRGQLAELRNQYNQLSSQVARAPKPLTSAETTQIARNESENLLHEMERRNRKMADLEWQAGSGSGPQIGVKAGYFSPFGGDRTNAIRFRGDLMNFGGSDFRRTEGQLGAALSHRYHNLQFGTGLSLDSIRLNTSGASGTLGQAFVSADLLQSPLALGVFGVRGFRDFAAGIGPLRARVADQVGLKLQADLGLFLVESSAAYLLRHADGPNADFTARGLRPLTERIAFVIETGINESLVRPGYQPWISFGFRFGNILRPKEYRNYIFPSPLPAPALRYGLR